MPAEKPRWVYRFDNYQRAFALLREAGELAGARELSALEQEGVIQRFEYTWELAWKLLADLLAADGVDLETLTPRAVIRAAFAAKLIADGEAWMGALDARNKMSHTYNLREFETVIEEIRSSYLVLFEALHRLVLVRASKP
jgi:nucleotidyltransferase substrate binding protein (TIGR01987 family)